MARRLNKNLVGALTLFGMVLLLVIGVLLVENLPGQDPKVYEADAKKLEDEKKYNEAAQMYLRAYRKDPAQDPEYLVMAARCALEDGSLRDAAPMLEQALVRDSELKSALQLSTEMEFEFARSFGGQTQWNRVRERASKLLEVDAQSPLAHYALSLAYLRLRDDDETYEAKGEEGLNRALALDPTNSDVVESVVAQLWVKAGTQKAEGRRAEAEALRDAAEATLESAIETCAGLGEDEKLADMRRLQGLYKILRGSVEEGVALLEKVMEAETNRADCHLLLANVYAGSLSKMVKPDLEKAEAIASRALEIDPKDGRVYDLLGQFYKGQGRHEEAAALYKRGLEEIPYRKHFRAFRDNRFRVAFMTELCLQEIQSAARARVDSDETKQAEALAAAGAWIETLKKEVHENSLPVRFLVAHLLNAQGDTIGATAEAEAANRLTGAERNYRLQQLLAELYVRRRQWGVARGAIERAQAARLRSRLRESPLLRLWEGQVYLQMGQPAAALRALKPVGTGPVARYLERDKTAARLRIEAFKQLGEFDQAAAEVELLGKGTSEAELERVEILVGEGRGDEAEQVIKAILEKEPDNPGAIRAMLLRYTTTNRLAEARAWVEGLLAKAPDNRQYRRWKLMLMEGGDRGSQDAGLEKFLLEEEGGTDRALSLFEFYRSRGRREEAIKWLDEAEKLEPDRPGVIERQLRAALQARDWERAEKYVVRHGELNLDGTAGKVVQGRLSFAKGTAYREEGQSDKARAEFSQAVESIRAGLDAYPNYSLGWAYLAESYLAMDRVGEAKEALQKALEIDPTNGFANRGLAEIAMRQGDEKTERKYLEKATKFLPNDPWVQQRYRIWKETENPREGIATREKIRQGDPTNMQNLILLARLYALPEVGDYDKAAEVYREALEVSKYDLGLAREVAGFFGREEVKRPAEGEALLAKLLKEEKDEAKKARVAAYLGQFYERQKRLTTAARHFRLAVSLDSSPVVLTLAAEFYTRTNQIPDALEYYGRVLKQAEEDAGLAKSTRTRIVSLLLASGALEEAKPRIDDYLQRYPDDPQGMVFEGAYHRMGGDIQKSQKAFDAYLEKHSDSALVLWQRGQLHILMGRWQAAINDLRRARAFQPDGLGYRHRIALADALIEVGKGDEAIDELRSILEGNPEEEAVAEALVDAYQRVDPPRTVDAENLIYTYIRRHPKDVRWPTLLGRLGERTQDWNKAINGYEAAAKLARYRGETVAALFDAYKAAGRPQEIVRLSEERLSTRLLDGMPGALSTLAWAYLQVGERQKCFEAYDRAMAAAGDDFRGYTQVVEEMSAVFGKETVLARAKTRVEADPENVNYLRALVHLLFINGQREEAIEVCEKISTLAVRDADKVFGTLAQAMLLGTLGRPTEAKAKYEAVLRINPKESMALNNMAYLLVEKMDNPAEALPYAEEANRLHPNNADILDTLGWVLAKNNRLGEAAGMLLRALEIDRDHLAAAYHLALVHVLRRELEEARLRLDSAKALAEKQGDRQYLPKITEALESLDRAGD